MRSAYSSVLLHIDSGQIHLVILSPCLDGWKQRFVFLAIQNKSPISPRNRTVRLPIVAPLQTKLIDYILQPDIGCDTMLETNIQTPVHYPVCPAPAHLTFQHDSQKALRMDEVVTCVTDSNHLPEVH